jgi:hypothetical protein
MDRARETTFAYTSERVRDVYEEGLHSVVTVRSLLTIFDALFSLRNPRERKDGAAGDDTRTSRQRGGG